MIVEMLCGICGVVWNVIRVLWDSVCNLYLNVVVCAWHGEVECGRDVEWCA